MKRTLLFILSLLITTHSMSFGELTPLQEVKGEKKIKVIYTAALLNHLFKMRKDEYIKCIKILNNYGYEPYVIESCKASSPSFFEDHTPFVFYANTNDYSLKNKGVNEAKAMIKAFEYYNFDDDDIIIKITGRYHLDSPYFLHVVENNQDADAFGKFDPIATLTDKGRVFTGCFALRCKYFKEFVKNLDLVKMEKEMIDIEREAAAYIMNLSEKGHKVIFLDKLDMTAGIAGGGNGFPNFIHL